MGLKKTKTLACCPASQDFQIGGVLGGHPFSLSVLGLQCLLHTEAKELFEWALDQEKALSLSPIFGVPAAHTGMIQLDWLHLVELGVGQDVCGNLLWEVLRVEGVLKGRSLQTRLAALNAWLQEHNKVHTPSNPIGRLTMAWSRQMGNRQNSSQRGQSAATCNPLS